MEGLGRFRTLFANRAVAFLTTAQLFSRLGDQFVAIGLLWETLGLTHSPSRAGLVLMAYSFAAVASGLFAGSMLDRFPRKTLMLVDNTLRAAFIGALAVFGALHRLALPELFAFAVAAAIVSAWTIVGVRAYLPLLVPESLLTTAFAADFIQVQTAGIVGPALAGLVTGRFGPNAALGVAAAFYVAFLPFATAIPGRALDAGVRPEAKPLSFAEELKGARYVFTHPVLRSMTALIFGSGILFSASIVGLAFLSQDSFGAGARGQGEMLAAEALGSVGAALFLGSTRWPYRRGLSLIIANLVFGLLIASVAWAGSLAVACLLLFVGGALDAAFFQWMSEIRQRTPPPELQARVVGASMILNFAGAPLGEGAAGYVVASIGARGLMRLTGALLAALSLAFVWRSRLRETA